MKPTVIALGAICLAATAARAQTPQGTSADTGPSLAETKQWLETEAPALLAYRHLSFPVLGKTDIDAYAVSALHLDQCVLTFTTLDSTIHHDRAGGLTVIGHNTRTIPLKDVDVGNVTNMVSEDSTVRVRVQLRAAAGAKITYRNEEKHKDFPLSTFTTLPAQSVESATRVATAIKRAAVLCGAAKSPY